MKPRLIVLALLAALGSGCASIDKPRQAGDIEPLLAVHHGASDAQSYYQLGRYYQGQRRLAQAEEAYLKAIAVDSRKLDAYNALGRLYAERGDFDRSAKTFERATTLAPGAAYLYNNLGFAYYLRGRLDDAYAAVRKALSLDSSLARGWGNLEKIAASRSDAALLAAIKARRFAALPSELTAAVPGKPPTAAPPAADPAGLAQLPATPSENVSPNELPTVTLLAADDQHQPNDAQEEPVAGGKFVLVSAGREAVAKDGVISIDNAAPASSTPHEPPPPRRAARLEVSNANGVARFATRFSAKLRSDDIPVARITNFGSSQLKQTIVEYQPGYEDQARELIDRTQLTIRVIPAIRSRPGSDIRIVLGLDALKFGEPPVSSLADSADQLPRRRLAS